METTHTRTALAEIQRDVDWVSVTIGWAIVALLFETATNLIGLYPLNNLKDNGPHTVETIIMWVGATLYIYTMYSRGKLPASLGSMLPLAWLGFHLREWYLPFLTQSGTLGWLLQLGYEVKLKLQPAMVTHASIPGLQQAILLTLALGMVATTLLALHQIWNQPKRSY